VDDAGSASIPVALGRLVKAGLVEHADPILWKIKPRFYIHRLTITDREPRKKLMEIV
jgi:hypothetical protein